MFKTFYSRLVTLASIILVANVLFLVYSGFTGAALHGKLAVAVALSFAASLVVVSSRRFAQQTTTEYDFSFDPTYFEFEAELKRQAEKDEMRRAKAAEEQQQNIMLHWIDQNRRF